MQKLNFFIVTGGPGAGKTTLIEALAETGFATVEEAGRRIIREQRETSGNATHEGDRLAYRQLMFQRDLESYRNMEEISSPVFFDRGLPDLIGYSRLIGAIVPPELDHAVTRYRYNDTVFIAPPWPEIYGADDERKQDLAEAIATYKAMRHAYEETGYTLVELPRVTVEERLRFVVEHVQAGGRFVAQSGSTPNSMSKTSGPST